MLSLFGSVLGFATSFLPNVLDYFKEKRDQAHELAMMDKQLEQQKVIGSQKLQMMHVDADIREGEAIYQHDSGITKKADQWVINLSASVRPVMTYLFFIEFFVLTAALNLDWISSEEYTKIWDEPMQAIFATVVSFWFGSRTFNRMRGHT